MINNIYNTDTYLFKNGYLKYDQLNKMIWKTILPKNQLLQSKIALHVFEMSYNGRHTN